MRVTDHHFLNHMLERLEPMGYISVRAMFGGHGIAYHGVVFALVAYEELYFRAGPDNIQRFKDAGSKPFVFTGKQKDGVSLSYWQLPAYVLTQDDALAEWVEAACLAAQGDAC